MRGVRRSVVQERDRIPLSGTAPGGGYRLMVDVMADFGSRARVATWRLDVRRTGAPGAENEWTIAEAERISSVDNIYRVALSAAKAMTFRQCAEAYIDAHRKSWKNDKHAAQWPASLNAYAYPVFGDFPVQAIEVGLVSKALEPIWSEKTETASRLRGHAPTRRELSRYDGSAS